VASIDKAAFFRKIGYEPHAVQWKYHRSNARFRLPCCGRRMGKSTMAARDLEPDLFIPDRRYWIVGPTYDLAEKEFRVIWNDLIIGMQMGKDKRIKKAFNKRSGEMYIEFPWQTRVECRSASHPETLVGERLDGAIMSEAAKHKKDTWERYIRAALSDRRGWATFPTTPEGFNWYFDLWSFGISDAVQHKDFESWRFPSWENNIIFPGGRYDPEIQLVESTTAPEWFLQEYAAEFGAFVGKIYGEFDPMMHVKSHKFNPDWPNYIAFDWGFTNPLAAIEFQVDPWDRVYVWREHYKSYMQLGEHIEMMKRREQPDGYHLDLGFGDAADPEAAMHMSTYFVPTHAMPEAKKNWREGVDLVKSFLKPRDSIDPSGLMITDEYGTPQQEPWLYIDPKCHNLIKEINNYRAPDVKSDVNTRESAKKWDDHALDALRYGLMHLFRLGCRAHLTDVYDSSELLNDSLAAQYLDRTSSGLYIASDGGFFSSNDLEF
jgi:hypothetical protein